MMANTVQVLVNLKHIDIDVEENVSTIIEVRPL